MSELHKQMQKEKVKETRVRTENEQQRYCKKKENGQPKDTHGQKKVNRVLNRSH